MLPKIDLPTYELMLPVTKAVILYRPFLVKEEKLLLMAAQGKDPKEITRSIMQIVNNCIVDSGKVKIEELASFEIDYLFLHMRGKSIGGTILQEFTCNNVVAGTKCGHVWEVSLSVDDAKLSNEPKGNTIKLSDKFSLKMKLPAFKTYDTEKENYEYEVLVDCIDCLYDDKDVYKFKDQTMEESIDFIEGLTKEQFNLIQEYYDSIPEIVIEKQFKCPRCSFEHKMRLDDPLDFF